MAVDQMLVKTLAETVALCDKFVEFQKISAEQLDALKTKIVALESEVLEKDQVLE